MLTKLHPGSLFLACSLCGLAGLYFAWGVCGTLTDLGGDSATYMLMARELSPFFPSSPMFSEATAGSTYPPLFPVLIGLFGGSFSAAHCVVVTSLLLALVFLYLWLRTEDLGAGMSLITVLLVAVMPGTYLLVLNIWSENPYLCLSLLTLVAASRARISDTALKQSLWWWAAVIATSAAITIRTAGFSLLLTLTAFITFRRPAYWWAMILGAWTPFSIWVLWSRLHLSGASLYAHQLSSFYGHDLFRHMREQIITEAQALFDAWLASWLGGPAAWPLVLLVVSFGALCMLGWLAALRKWRFDAVYILFYMTMLLIWPWPGEAQRLLYVIVPIVVGYGIRTMGLVARWVGRHTRYPVQYVVPALLMFAILPPLLICVHRRLQEVPAEIAVVKYIPTYYSGFPQDYHVAVATAQILADLPQVSQRVPESECVFQIKPSAVVLLAGRMSRLPPPVDANDEEFTKSIKNCRYAYVMKIQSPTTRVAFYPRDRLRSEYRTLTVLPDKVAPDDGPLAELLELLPAAVL